MPATHASPDERRSMLSQALMQAGISYTRGAWPDAERFCRLALQADGDHVGALNLLAAVMVRTGRLHEAAPLLARATAADPRDAASHNNYGSVLRSLKRHAEALEEFERAVSLEPMIAESHFNRGNTLLDTGRLSEAVLSYDRALRIRANYFEAYNNRGNALQMLGRYEEAVASYDELLRLKPHDAGAYNNRGTALHRLNRFQAAVESFARALQLQPGSAEAHYNIANAQRALQCLEEALQSYRRALQLKPDHAEACMNYGLTLLELACCKEAAESLRRAVEIDPTRAEAYNNLGNAQCRLGCPQEALESYQRALHIRPEYAEAHGNRGNALRDLKRFEEALESYAHALALRPDCAEFCNNRGNALQDLKRYDEALASYDEALALRPNYADAYSNRGNVLRSLQRYPEALECYDRSLVFEPEFATAHYNRGNALQDLRRFDEAVEYYQRALKLGPDQPWLYGNWLHVKMQLCDWCDPDIIAPLAACLANAKPVTAPFPVVVALDSPALQRRAAEIWVQHNCPETRVLAPIGARHHHEKIRIGYYSADFHGHATAYLAAELFERHDRERFELTAFSYGADVRDDMRQRIRAAFERFVEVRAESDREIALLSRRLEIDIAVDLKGFTQHARTGIFAHRAAPIQVNYLGYPGTMAASYIDYIIADHVLIPGESRSQYSEKIAYLPFSYQVNDRRRPIAAGTPARNELGLPATGFVFCCFNNVYKILPETFSSWMRILRQVDDSVLWLLSDSTTAVRHLRAQAVSRGVSASRIIFADPLPLPQHLARYRVADLFLDTLPCNGHTTASDALWAGLPVLTCLGQSFAARVAASLLNALGLHELITTSREQYELLAVGLARANERLAALRERLTKSIGTAPLFDTPQFVGHLEAAYREMYARYRQGLAPAQIEISA